MAFECVGTGERGDWLLHKGDSLWEPRTSRDSKTYRGNLLVDLLHAPTTSRAPQIATWAQQLDDVSHVLVWMPYKADYSVKNRIETVEFPRLGLSFTANKVDKEERLLCDQHGGLAALCGSVTDDQLRNTLLPFPRYVLLEGEDKELFALVSIADRPFRASDGRTQLQRGSDSWISEIPTDQRHHLFGIHASREFVTATSTAAVTLAAAQGFAAHVQRQFG